MTEMFTPLPGKVRGAKLLLIYLKWPQRNRNIVYFHSINVSPSQQNSPGDIKQLKLCLVGMKDINKRDFIGGTGRTILHEAVVNGRNKCVEILLQSKTLNVNQTTLLGKESALHLAVQRSNRDIAFNLLYHGANPNLQNKIGATPLHHTKEKAIASLLIKFGAKPIIKDFTSKKQKPVESALERGMKKSSDLVRFLMEAEDALNKDIRKIRQKQAETEIPSGKENMDQEGRNSARWKRQSKLDYLSWRTGDSVM